MENQHIWGRQVQEAVSHLKTHRHKFVSLYNRCAKESDEASRSQSKPTPDLTAKQSELELDVFGHVMECNAAVWKGVQRDEFLLQNLEVNPLQLPEGVQRGTVSRNAVLVEATRSNDIRILKFKLCKMEKNLTGMLLTRGRGKDICQCVSVCLLATEVHNGGAKLREELEAFVQSNADALLIFRKSYPELSERGDPPCSMDAHVARRQLEERPRVVKKCAWGSISPEVPKSQSTFGQGPPPQVQQARRQDRQPDSQEFDKTSSGFSIGIIRSRWISCFEVSPGGIVVKPGACSFDFRIRPSFGLAIEQQYW
eukprot:gene17782-24157_t